MNTRHSPIILITLTLGMALTGACGSSEPRTDAEKLARGKEIVERMSAKLGGTQAFSVATREAREEIKPSGTPHKVNLTRETVIRRGPDRLHTKTAGDTQNEAWYDGVGLTLVLHKDKVFAQARMPETLDKTLDSMHERYGAAIPLADFAYTSPAKALLTDAVTGGWVAREMVDGKATDHLAFKDTGVTWELWVPAEGDPLPVRAVFDFPEAKRLRKTEITFTNWNLAPQIADNRFTPTVPADYEGIAMLQRARVLRHIAKDEEQQAPKTGEQKK
jgi:hypothetical protein